MDSHSVSISSADEADEWRIDVPMRSFQGGKLQSSFSRVYL